jgi:hypothetical protein
LHEKKKVNEPGCSLDEIGVVADVGATVVLLVLVFLTVVEAVVEG